MKKRIISICLIGTMILMCLSGCAAIGCSVSINSDGSGIVSMRLGVTQEALELVAKNIDQGASWTDVLDSSQTVPFTKNGVTYYGSNEQYSFSNLGELSQILGGIGSSSDAGAVMNISGITLLQNADKSFDLTVKDLCNKKGIEDAVAQLGGGVADRTEQLSELAQAFEMEISFTFPSAVVQTAGTNAGVTVSGNTVTLDAVHMSGTYSFSTSSSAVSNVTGPFSDVALSAWYCKAVSALSQGGLVNGAGNGKFLPTESITYSQLCQIIAKAKGLPTGSDESGYWAAKAIQSCVSERFLASRGDTTPANYDVAISREAATSALMRAVPKSLLVETNPDPVIPDRNDIAPAFLADVLNAYRYGVAKGTGNGVFSPKSSLSRAEVCQLLFNIGWTSPA